MPRETGPGSIASTEVIGPDEDSRLWLHRLRTPGEERTAAVGALFEMLHRGARLEAQRRRGSLPAHVVDDLDDLTRQAADDAVVAVLGKLDDYRGASRFTTWAYKFAIFEVSTRLRRETWRGRALTIEDLGLDQLADATPVDPASATEARELMAAVERAIATELTARQREVFVAIVVKAVPVDVVAERRGSTRGATYKVLHDARRRLQLTLSRQGWSTDAPGMSS